MACAYHQPAARVTQFIVRSNMLANRPFTDMSHPALPALLLIALAPAATSDDVRPSERVELAQLVIRQRIVIRIPRVLGGPARLPRSEPVPPRRGEKARARTIWAEKKGPKCVPAATLVGVVVDDTDSVDLMMIDGTRMRARLDDKCPALDFYTGVYIKQSEDGLVCADRDSIRARSGSICEIDGFRRLELKR